MGNQPLEKCKNSGSELGAAQRTTKKPNLWIPNPQFAQSGLSTWGDGPKYARAVKINNRQRHLNRPVFVRMSFRTANAKTGHLFLVSYKLTCTVKRPSVKHMLPLEKITFPVAIDSL